MKRGVGILLLFISNLAFSQKKSADFNRIERNLRSADAVDPFLLSKQLTAPYNTEFEKVRSIFRWITENIEYRIRQPYWNKRRHPANTLYEELDTAAELKPVNEIIAMTVLRRRTALCDGYARLFKSLCDHAGIRSEIINGYARAGAGRAGERFRTNHTWNAVLIDSNWYLLDATWASGAVSYYGNQFIKRYDDYYFLTPPEQLIRSHYPDDLRWALLSDPPALQEFRQSPFKQTAFVKYSISSYLPKKGIIDAMLGDTITVELEAKDFERDKRIAPTSIEDSSVFSAVVSAVFLQPIPGEGSKILYSYPVESPNIEWLHIVYNNDVIMRYRLNVKKN